LQQHDLIAASGQSWQAWVGGATINNVMRHALPRQVLCGREVVVCGAIGPAASMRKAGPRVAEVPIGDGACCAVRFAPCWTSGHAPPQHTILR